MLFAEMPYDRDLDVSSGTGAMQVPECGDREMEWTTPLEGCGLVRVKGGDDACVPEQCLEELALKGVAVSRWLR
jgi:hypothetical protein